MSKAQGQFTIIDYNDALTLTGYIGSNLAKTQMYNPDNGSYTPDWKTKNLVLTPSLYVIGTTADQIATEAQFFSFGTNDLTQTGLGMSRDDSGSFLPQYQELEIIKKNVFASIDQNGVGKLMKIAVELGRSTRPDIKLGICGEHGGDPASVKFCNTLGLTYVSCSPYRVPTARLAAAQAALEQE